MSPSQGQTRKVMNKFYKNLSKDNLAMLGKTNENWYSWPITLQNDHTREITITFLYPK